MGDSVDDEAMVAFCRTQHTRLVGVLAYSVGDRFVAEELAQETLIRVCQHWPKVRDMAAPEAWAHRVAQNLASSWVRRRIAERRATRRVQAHPVAQVVEPTADVVALRAEIKRLPARQRTALVLRYFADLPAAQVATVMGCSDGTVRALTHQAISALRERGELTGLQEVTDAI